MYTKILVALDGSEVSERVLPYARFFAKWLKPPVELLQVIDPETLMPASTAERDRQDIPLTERKKKEEYLGRIAKSFSDVPSVGFKVRVGKPADVIVDEAANDIKALIAIGTHGRSGIQRWLLGSVADKVLHATANHLLLVRTTEEAKKVDPFSLKSILVPLDGSELAESVMPHVAELAKQMNLEIILVRVFNLPSTSYDEGYWSNEQIWELIRDEAQDYLERKTKQLRNEGLGKVTPVLLEGYAAERIINLAQGTPQNLIALCTHGRSGVGRWVLGSVTDRVVRHSGDPVLVMRPSSRT